MLTWFMLKMRALRTSVVPRWVSTREIHIDNQAGDWLYLSRQHASIVLVLVVLVLGLLVVPIVVVLGLLVHVLIFLFLLVLLLLDYDGGDHSWSYYRIDAGSLWR